MTLSDSSMWIDIENVELLTIASDNWIAWSVTNQRNPVTKKLRKGS